MILIADSGSTKTDWRTLDTAGAVAQAKTTGINPYHLSESRIAAILQQELLPQVKPPVTRIYFYGAGCATPAASDRVRGALSAVFPGAGIEVHSDLLAAARALCGHAPGIACILGTGANSCLYDGLQIIDHIPPLGYILGDEGSGAYIGKTLLNAYLKRDMPAPLAQQFEKRYTPTVAEVLENTYRGTQPGPYLASFAKFAFHHLKHPYMAHLIYESFAAFFQKNVTKYERYREQPVHFTGSVAFYYANLLRQVASDQGITVRNIMETPIAGLTLYHQSAKH